MTMFTTNYEQTLEMIKDCLKNRLVPYITSSPGKGKSSIVKQFAKDNNLYLIDCRLSTMLPEDLNGLCFKNGNRAEYLPFNVFPLIQDTIPEGYKGWLLFFDELSGAKMDTQIASYRIMLDREVGQHKLHDKCYIIAAGNNLEDNAGVEEMSTALRSRLIHLSFDITLDDWIYNFALPNKIDPRIIAFLQYKPEAFNYFDPESTDKTFPCPRTYSFLSKLIKNKNNLENYMHYISGSIGDSVSSDFYTFTQFFSKLPTIQDIVNGNPININNEELQFKFAFIQYLISHYDYVKNDELYMKWSKTVLPNTSSKTTTVLDKILDLVNTFDNPEFVAIFATSIFKLDNGIFHNKRFSVLVQRTGKFQ